MNRRRFLSMITQNFGLKLFAFCTSLMIWLWVQTKQTYQERIRSQVQYILPKDLVLLNQPSQIVTITLEGPKGVMRQFQNMDIQTNINLNSHKAGSLDAEFNANDIVNLPSGVKVIQFSPPAVNVALDEQLKRTLKVDPNLSGTPLRGWKLTETKISPETITVVGAKTILSNLASIQTMGISLSDRSKTNNEKISLEKKHPSFVFEGMDSVQVELILEQEQGEQKYERVPIFSPTGWVSTPDKTDIIVQGPLLEVEILKISSLRLEWKPPEDWDQSSPFNPNFTLYSDEIPLTYSFQVLENSTFKKETSK